MARDVIVLAGGPSVAQYNLRGLEERGELIAVNDAALYTKCDVAFTMDRMWLEGRQLLLKTLGPPQVWYRLGTPKNFKPPGDWVSYMHDGRDPTLMTLQGGYLNGSNSGTCAVNLAFQRKARRTFLLGFDMQRGAGSEKHWYPDYPWTQSGTKTGTYRDWTEEFAAIAEQFAKANLQLYNVNHRSLIKTIPEISYEIFLEVTR